MMTKANVETFEVEELFKTDRAKTVYEKFLEDIEGPFDSIYDSVKSSGKMKNTERYLVMIEAAKSKITLKQEAMIKAQMVDLEEVKLNLMASMGYAEINKD